MEEVKGKGVKLYWRLLSRGYMTYLQSVEGGGSEVWPRFGI